ncbi:MAG: hypothetical protein IKD45_05090 [Clostridia bacterium]|nr:hypothetical protein [Clostridia bacterium]
MARTLITRTQEGKILHLECHESVPSTHELARSYATLGYTDGYVVFSEVQTKYSSIGAPLPAGSSERGVYLSCILRPSIFPSQAGSLGAMAAVSLLTALEEHTVKRLGIGWVSDIFCEGKKIGTATIEGKLDNFSAYEYIIISFSVKLSDADFPPRVSDLVNKIFGSENISIPFIIAKNILSKFFSFYPKRIKSGERFMDIYKRKFILSDLRTKYYEGGKKKRCKIIGIDSNDGKLVIETRGGELKSIANRSVIIPNKIKLKNKKN